MKTKLLKFPAERWSNQELGNKRLPSVQTGPTTRLEATPRKPLAHKYPSSTTPALVQLSGWRMRKFAPPAAPRTSPETSEPAAQRWYRTCADPASHPDKDTAVLGPEGSSPLPGTRPSLRPLELTHRPRVVLRARKSRSGRPRTASHLRPTANKGRRGRPAARGMRGTRAGSAAGRKTSFPVRPRAPLSGSAPECWSPLWHHKRTRSALPRIVAGVQFRYGAVG